MIDWIAAMIELHHAPLSSGAVVCIEADGTVAWETPRNLNMPLNSPPRFFGSSTVISSGNWICQSK